MTSELPPRPKGTRFPNLPALPSPPDPTVPLRAVLDGIRQIQSQGDAAMSASDELSRTLKDGMESLARATKARLKTPPFPKKGA